MKHKTHDKAAAAAIRTLDKALQECVQDSAGRNDPAHPESSGYMRWLEVNYASVRRSLTEVQAKVAAQERLLESTSIRLKAAENAAQHFKEGREFWRRVAVSALVACCAGAAMFGTLVA